MTDNTTSTGGLAGSRHSPEAVKAREAMKRARRPKPPEIVEDKPAKPERPSIMHGEQAPPEPGFVGSAASNSRWSPEAVAARARERDRYLSNTVTGSMSLDESEEVVVIDGVATIIGHPTGWDRLVERSFAAQSGNAMGDDDAIDYGPSYDPDTVEHEDQLLGTETRSIAKLPDGPSVGQAMTTERRFA